MKPTLEAALKCPITRGRSDSDTRSDSRALQMDRECLNSPETEKQSVHSESEKMTDLQDGRFVISRQFSCHDS